MKEELIRKGGNTAGKRTQTMCSFRLDNDLKQWLDAQSNKGRLINNLLRAEKEREEGQ